MKKWAAVCLVAIISVVSFAGLATRFSMVAEESVYDGPIYLYGDAIHAHELVPWEETKGPDIEPLLPAPGYWETSEYMMGSAAVAVVLPESTGAASTEDWNSTEIAKVKNEIQDGLDWWAAQESDAFISFEYNFTYVDSPVSTTYEPISVSCGNHDQWIDDVMTNLGYTTGNIIQKTRDFINDLRDAHGTDWSFVIFVADSSNDADGMFPDCIAYALLGGPFEVMSYNNNGWGEDNMNRVVAHETGHIFWALDEYASSNCLTSDRTGYLNADNPNCENGGPGNPNIMLDTTLTVLTGTQRQIGWLDTDTDGVMDILDIPPGTTLIPYTPDPTGDNTPTYTGTSTVVAAINQNPQPSNSGNDVTINKIADVEYRVDGGVLVPWTSATPSDGAFDEDAEAYEFTTPPLPDGMHTIEARAKITVNGVDLYDATPASDTLTIITDTTKPTSSVDALPMYTGSFTFIVTVTASDDPGGSGVKNVTLWFSKDGAPYEYYGTDLSPPWSFNFNTIPYGGDGLYEFYSRAYDNMDNYEDAPLVNDTWTLVDTQKPSSSANSLPTFTTVPNFAVDITTLPDASGIGSVELWYEKDDAGDLLYGTDLSEPWSFNFDTLTTGGDGKYEFYSIAYDGAGNMEDVPMMPDTTTIVDTQEPLSSVTPFPTYTNTASFTVTTIASDLTSGVKNVSLWYNKDGAGYIQYATDVSPPWSFDFDSLSTGGDGHYEFYSRASDNASNYEVAPFGNDTWTIVDTQKPSSAVDPLPMYTTSTVFSVDATALPDANGIQMVELWLSKDGSGWGKYMPDDTISPYSWSLDSSTTGGDGTYEFYSRAMDNADNQEDAPLGNDTWTVVDTLEPSSSVDALAPYTNTESFTVTISASDPTSGIENVTLWYNKDGGAYQSYSTDSSMPWSFSFDTLATGGDGLYEFYSTAYDKAGNLEGIPTIPPDASTVVDTQNPSSSVEPLPTYTTTALFTIDVTASDLTSGLSNVTLWFNKDGAGFVEYGTDSVLPWSFTFDTSVTGGDGVYEFYSRAYDNASNHEDIPVLPPDATTIVDTLKPSSTADALPNHTNTSVFTVDVTAQPDTNGIERIELWHDKDGAGWTRLAPDVATPPYSWSINTTILGGEGLYEFYSRAYDNAGNYEDAPLPFVADTSTFVDITPPEVQITAPSMGEWLGGLNVVIDWTGLDTSSGINHYEVKLDDGNWIVAGVFLQHTFTGLSEGQFTVYVRAFDNAFNSNTTSVTFNMDQTPPILTITSPSGNSQMDGPDVTITWTGSDPDSGIGYYEVMVDGGNVIYVGSNNSHTFHNLNNGTHVFTVRAVDNAGQAVETSIYVQVGESDDGGGNDNNGGKPTEWLEDFWWIFLLLATIIIIVIIVLILAFHKAKRRREAIENYELMDEPFKP